VPAPVVAGDELIAQERVTRVRGLGKAPLDSEIRSKTDDEDALARLRDAIVRGVEQLENDVVTRFGLRARSLRALQPPEVIEP